MAEEDDTVTAKIMLFLSL